MGALINANANAIPRHFRLMVVLRYTQKAQFVSPAKVDCVAFSRDGKFLAAGAGNIITIWNISTQDKVLNYVDSTSVALSIAWGPGGTVHCGFQSGYVITTVIDDMRRLVSICQPFFEQSDAGNRLLQPRWDSKRQKNLFRSPLSMRWGITWPLEEMMK